MMTLHVTQYMPLLLSAVAATYCVMAAYKWRVLRHRYIWCAVICALYAAANIRWVINDVWAVVDPDYSLERYIWDTLESLIFVAFLYLARIPADVGFR